MAQGVRWSPEARDDLRDIAQSISRDSRRYANAVIRSIVEATRKLERFPNAGRMVPEMADPELREVFSYSYRVLYRVKADHIRIVAVPHGRQNLRP